MTVAMRYTELRCSLRIYALCVLAHLSAEWSPCPERFGCLFAPCSAAVQNALNNLKTDCEAVRAKLAETQVIDQENKAHNSTRTITHWLSFAVFFMFSLLIPLSLALSKLEIALGLITMLKDAVRLPNVPCSSAPPSVSFRPFAADW